VHQRIEAIAIAVLWTDRSEPTEAQQLSQSRRVTRWIGEVPCPGCR
jgi:hypothetical protein